LGNRLMILGYLDELHAFSADDVNRVAADLANETDSSDALPVPGANGAANGSGQNPALASRLDAIEDRLAKQEALTRRAGMVVQQFLNLVNSDTP
jgi:general secretion pathway protein A